MSEWDHTTIGALIEQWGGSIKTGPFGTILKASEYTTTGVPLISVGEVGYGTFRVGPHTPRVGESVTNRLPEYVLRTGDIVFGRKGAVDRSAIITADQDGWFLGSDGIRLRLPGICDPRFVFYWLSRRASRDWLLQQSTGSTMASLNQSIIGRLPISLPPLSVQKTISEDLAAIDDKIELNRRTNQTLEAMAQAIFRDWFVDFGPVRRKMAGEIDPVAIMGGLTPDPVRAAELAALFPAFEEDGQPQGWGLATLAELAVHCKGSINPLAHQGVEFEHYSLPAFDSGQEPAIDPGADIKSNKTPVPEGAVLLSKLNPEIPRIWLPNPPSGRQQIASTEFLIFQPLPGVGRGLLYCLFRDPTVRQILAGMVTGTSKSHQRISPPALMKTPLLIGSGEAFGAFGEFAEPLLQRVLSLRAENRTLAETRDYLLPRLMSGAVRVRDSEATRA